MNMEELKKYCITNHRKMWNWLSDNPDKNKKDWPGWESHNDDIFPKDEENYCFLCGYISCIPDYDCFDCPIDWGVTEKCIDAIDPAISYDDLDAIDPAISYYELYLDAGDAPKYMAKYAKIIANLPEKDNTEERLIMEEPCGGTETI